MGFEKLSDILKRIRNHNPALGNRLKEAETLTYWESAVGPQIAKHTRIVRIQEGVLWVEVDHPIWKTELHFRKRQILDALNMHHEQTQSNSSELRPPQKNLIHDIHFIDSKQFDSQARRT